MKKLTMLLFALLYCLSASAMDLNDAPESENVIDLRLPQNPNRYSLARQRFPITQRAIINADSSIPDFSKCPNLIEPRREFHHLAESLREKNPEFPAEDAFVMRSSIANQISHANACSGSLDALRSTVNGIRSRIDSERKRLIGDFSTAANKARKIRADFYKAKQKCAAPEQANILQSVNYSERLLKAYSQYYDIMKQVMNDYSRSLRTTERQLSGFNCKSATERTIELAH